jgi:hypothetical protein
LEKGRYNGIFIVKGIFFCIIKMWQEGEHYGIKIDELFRPGKGPVTGCV